MFAHDRCLANVFLLQQSNPISPWHLGILHKWLLNECRPTCKGFRDLTTKAQDTWKGPWLVPIVLYSCFVDRFKPGIAARPPAVLWDLLPSPPFWVWMKMNPSGDNCYKPGYWDQQELLVIQVESLADDEPSFLLLWPSSIPSMVFIILLWLTDCNLAVLSRAPSLGSVGLQTQIIGSSWLSSTCQEGIERDLLIISEVQFVLFDM